MKHLHLAFGLCAFFAFAAPGRAQQHDHAEHAAPAGATVGKVSFATSCKPQVQAEFDRAVALLHSFWFAESRGTFEQVLRADPECAMAHWGVALTYWSNPFAGQRSPQVIALGKAAIEQAAKVGTPTEREKGFIDAAAILFSNADPVTQRERVLAYESAMEKVAAANPTDVEAQIFWALSVAQSALPTDKTFAKQLRAAEILQPWFQKLPDHPGLAHYIIHAYDVPPLASRALPAARAYAGIAPAVPHALHMPSHTFTRLGLWRDSVASNTRSADVAEKAGEPGEALHALDYMTYAYLQMAMDAEADAARARGEALQQAQAARRNADGSPMALANPFAIAAIPARLALERQDWAAASQLDVVATPATPYIEAIGHFARAVGASRAGNPAAAKADVARLAALRDRELELKDAYWADIVDIQRRGAEAWMTFAEGRRDEGIRLMSAAADAEDLTEKAAVTPGPLAPAREMLGFMLLEAGKAVDALKAFDATLAKEPNRFLALYGAGKAAEKLGRREEARKRFRQLVDLCEGASSRRPELVYARNLVSKR